MRAFLIPVVWLTTVSCASLAVSTQRSSRLDGAWAHVATRIVAPDTTLIGPVLSGLGVIFGGHFSEVFVVPGTTGARQIGTPLTAEQKASRFDALVAISGTIEVRDSSVTFRHEQDKNPSMLGTRDTRHFRVRGDTLWLTSTSVWERDSTKSVYTILTLVRRH